MAGEADNPILGEVVSLNKRARLLIPAAMRKATPWLRGTEPIPLLAELLPGQQLRLHPADQAQPMLERLRQRLADGGHAGTEILAALADRYRYVTFYASDTQVHLGESIAVHLRPPLSEMSQFYAEVLGPYIHVMTLEQRSERLERLLDELNLQ